MSEVNTIQQMLDATETRQLVLTWDQDTHSTFLQMLENFTAQYGRPPVYVGMRNELAKYQLEIFCKVASTFFVDVPNVKVLEIGSYFGDSALIFSKYFDEILAVDPYGLTNQVAPIDDLQEDVKCADDETDMYVKFDPTQELVRFYFENQVVASNDNIDFCRMTSDDFFYNNLVGPKSSQYPKRRFDLIYIDGDHRYSQQIRDYTNALACLTPEGIVAGHDFSWESTKRVIKELGFDKKPIVVFGDDSFMILPKYMH